MDFSARNRESFKPLDEIFSENTRKKSKGAKIQGHLTVGGAFICRNMIG